MTHIAFIGLGNMGRPMAANLAKAGYVVHGFDLTPFVRDGAAKEGVVIASSTVEALEGAEVMIAMLPGGSHVLSVWTECCRMRAKVCSLSTPLPLMSAARAGPMRWPVVQACFRSMPQSPAALVAQTLAH